MTAVRRFTPAGVDAARQLIARIDGDPGIDASPLLDDHDLTEVVPGVEPIDRPRFVDRRDAAEYLHRLLAPLEQQGSDPLRDVGLWTWLSLYWLDVLAPLDKGQRRSGHMTRWVPAVDEYSRYYRHLLAGPYRIYHAHSDDPDRAMALLATRVSSPGEVVEQFASRQEIVNNPNLVRAITLLYYDPIARRLKSGATRKGHGGARRLADLLLQLDLTFDIHTMDAESVLGLLPAEFDEFKS